MIRRRPAWTVAAVLLAAAGVFLACYLSLHMKTPRRSSHNPGKEPAAIEAKTSVLNENEQDSFFNLDPRFSPAVVEAERLPDGKVETLQGLGVTGLVPGGAPNPTSPPRVTCVVSDTQELETRIEEMTCPTIYLVSGRTYLLTNEIVIRTSVVIIGNPANRPMIDARLSSRAFRITNGGSLDMSFVHLRPGRGINVGITIPATLIIRGGGLWIQEGGAGTFFDCIFERPLVTEMLRDGLIPNINRAIVYGGTVLFSGESGVFTQCIFITVQYSAPTTEGLILVGGHLLVTGGNLVLTGCHFVNTIYRVTISGVGFLVTVLGGTFTWTGGTIAIASGWTALQGSGWCVFVGGGTVIMTGVSIALALIGNFAVGTGAFTVGGGVLVATGITFANSSAFLFRADVGTLYFVGGGVLILVGNSLALAGAIGAFFGLGQVAFLGAGYMLMVGMTLLQVTAISQSMFFGLAWFMGGGHIDLVGCALLIVGGLSNNHGYGGLIFLGAGVANFKNNAVDVNSFLVSFVGNGILMYSRESNVTVQRSDFNTRRFGGIGNPCSMNFFEADPRTNVSERCADAGFSPVGRGNTSLNQVLKLIFPGGNKAVTIFRMVKVLINTDFGGPLIAESIGSTIQNASDKFNNGLPWQTPTNVIGVHSTGQSQCHLCEVTISDRVGLFDPKSDSEKMCNVKDRCKRDDYLEAGSLPEIPVLGQPLGNLSNTLIPLPSARVHHYSAMIGFTCTAGLNCPKETEVKKALEGLVGLPTEGIGLTVAQPQPWLDALNLYEDEHPAGKESAEKEFQLQMAGTNGAALDGALSILRNLTIEDPSLLLDRIAEISGFAPFEMSNWRMINELSRTIPTFEAKGGRRLRSLWSCDDTAHRITLLAPKVILLLDNSPSSFRFIMAGASFSALIQGFKYDAHLSFQLVQHLSGREDKVIRTLRELRKINGSCADVQLTLLADDDVGRVHYVKVVDLNDPDGAFSLSQTFTIIHGESFPSSIFQEETVESMLDDRESRLPQIHPTTRTLVEKVIRRHGRSKRR